MGRGIPPFAPAENRRGGRGSRGSGPRLSRASAAVAGAMSGNQGALGVSGDDVVCSPRIILSRPLAADPADLCVGSNLCGPAFVVAFVMDAPLLPLAISAAEAGSASSLFGEASALDAGSEDRHAQEEREARFL